MTNETLYAPDEMMHSMMGSEIHNIRCEKAEPNDFFRCRMCYHMSLRGYETGYGPCDYFSGNEGKNLDADHSTCPYCILHPVRMTNIRKKSKMLSLTNYRIKELARKIAELQKSH